MNKVYNIKKGPKDDRVTITVRRSILALIRQDALNQELNDGHKVTIASLTEKIIKEYYNI